MSADKETLAVYQAKASAYAAMIERENHPGLEAFLAVLPDKARVLDLGCGTGAMARRMMDAGLDVDAVDASPAMLELARDRGVPARLATFDDLTAQAAYDGVWANFSLLHARRTDLPKHLRDIHRALKPAGWLHIGMKLGQGESRDGLGRFYTYYGQDELMDLLTVAGFTPTAHKLGEGKGLSGESSPWIWIHAHG